ncbi:hypothetical protein TSUD_55850 [Trifolium subterraneum]|uniref:Transglycosylase SLT domain-containing protein n=1 Tax=Trifolium subterraneum TaxID=3900 RepID=A0A2Z6ME13_TRISU|nr:hypothetical protein TSUD_55850 [Trifolium subterraneum]
MAAANFTYWDDCVEPQDLEDMWNIPEVSAEWLKAGEERDQKVHLSRDPDGQPYLTQTEMRAVADIVVGKHFLSEINPAMVCSIAELESDRQLLVMNPGFKTKELNVGLMQLPPKTADWLIRANKDSSALGYCTYVTEENIEYLFRPFINVYLAAAYLKWLSHFDNIQRNEEFIVRAYKGGTKKAIHKSTLRYWQNYLAVKETFANSQSLGRNSIDDSPPEINVVAPLHSLAVSPIPSDHSKDANHDIYWDSRVYEEDMESMWNHPAVRKAWTKSKEKPGKVRFSQDEKKRPYLSRVEMKAVADIILLKHLSSTNVKPTVICAIGEVISMRYVHGVGPRTGIMGIDYSTAYWLHSEMGFRAYKLDIIDDLTNPFVSMYFGAAYVTWLSEYEGRDRTPQFFVQAYFVGPKNVNPQDASTLWLKYEETLSKYEDERKRNGDSCSIM